MVCAWVIVAYGLARSGACWGAWARVTRVWGACKRARNRACVGAWVWSRARSSVMARGRVYGARITYHLALFVVFA